MNILVKAKAIIDGISDETLCDGAILIKGQRIEEIGRQSELKPGIGTRVVDAHNKTIVPGLIDCHVHLCGGYQKWVHRRYLDQAITESVLLGVSNAKRCVEAGVLTVRDAGCGHLGIFQIKTAINSGQVIGPRLLVSGRPIAMTGGHGWSFAWEADGPYEVRKAVREQLRWGADCIKFMATGGGSTQHEEMDQVQLDPDELIAGVREARKKNKRTLAHCDNAEGVVNCVEAGVDSIEHGLVLSREALNAMAKQDTYYVPTAYTHWLTAMKGKEVGASEWDIRKCRAIIECHKEAIQKAYRKGIGIATGTDHGSPRRPPGSDLVSEIEILMKYGMRPMDAIKSATYVSACNLGIEKSVGTIEKGKLADIVAVDGDPLDDLSNLRRVSLVMKEGQVLYKAGASVPQVDSRLS